MRNRCLSFTIPSVVSSLGLLAACGGGEPLPGGQALESAQYKRPVPTVNKEIGQADCTSERLGTDIPVSAIGEPVSGVALAMPVWVAAAGANPAYCRVNGSMAPIDPTAPNINFQVVLPSSWSHRAVQLGGGGQNGSIPGLTGGSGAGGTYLSRGWAATGSDSGHQVSDTANNWATNDEAIKNLGYMQMKKTHDAAQVLMQRMYGARPSYFYWVGNSQGGREGLTVAKRYPADYDGILVTVPIVGYSSLMLSRALHRIQEKPLANWIQTPKITTIATNVVRQCDGLDGLLDGVVNNYRACRALFDVKRSPQADPWAPIRCPGNVDPNPSLATAEACLTEGQISTMNFVQTPYEFANALAFGQRSFGMWVPNTDPGGSGMITNARFQGQEGAAANAGTYSWLGVAIVGMLWGDMSANPLDYVEGGALDARRKELSEWLDGTHPDLTAFKARGGKLISVVGTNDSLASSGQQLDYYQSVLDRMGRSSVDAFARLYVVPHANHGLGGTNYRVNGNGDPIATSAIPSSIDRLALLTDWVENGIAPPMAPVVTGGGRSMPLCSYPTYPRYLGADLPATQASSYECVE